MGVYPKLKLPLSLPVTDTQLMILRLGIVQTVASGCCDSIAQCIMVRINDSSCTYLNDPFIRLINLQRSIVVGLCGIKISVLLSFLR